MKRFQGAQNSPNGRSASAAKPQSMPPDRVHGGGLAGCSKAVYMLNVVRTARTQALHPAPTRGLATTGKVFPLRSSPQVDHMNEHCDCSLAATGSKMLQEDISEVLLHVLDVLNTSHSVL